jgi:hypothetical protein
MMSYSPSLRDKAAAELERRRRQRAALLAPYRDDVAAFIDTHIIIDAAQDDGELGLMSFTLWPAQRDLLGAIHAERLLLILKARQLGISWLCCAYALWLCVFKANRVVLIFSKSQDEANELTRRVSVMYHRLGDALRSVLPALVKDNTEGIEWANGSRIMAMPATKSSGRTFTASLIIADEFAFMQWAAELYTSIKPTIDGGGKMLILSTANGTGNLFHELWDRAAQRLGRFAARFLDWRARPDRDEAWYAATAADAVQSSLMGQEYPATPEEAFSATNAARFLPSILWWDNCRAELPALTPYEPLVLAADAGVSNDYFALVGVTRHPERHEDVAVRLVLVWRPIDGPLDFAAIQAEIEQQVLDRYNVILITYDAYQLHQMMTQLGRRVWTDAFSQAGERLTADKQLLDLTQSRRIVFDPNMSGAADLRAALDNADRAVDAESHKLRIVKRKDSLKIDPAVACSMASYRCLELNL